MTSVQTSVTGGFLKGYGMETILLDTVAVRDGCWLTRINSTYLERLAPELIPEVATSVVVVDEAEYDEKGQALVVRGAPLTPVLIGTSDTALVLTREKGRSVAAKKIISGQNGDEVFLHEVSGLPAWAQDAARQIIRAVRDIDQGHLERGERNKFVNRPDNFWTITPQPRAKGLAITVYGRSHRFNGGLVRVLDDRPGHSRFVIRDSSEVPDAIRLIGEAKKLKS